MNTQDVFSRTRAFLRNGASVAAAPQRQLTLLAPAAPPDAIEKTIWGSPAGKKRLAARLVKLIPAHKIYVEPFAGSAAVFFEKEPAPTEALGDADPEIAAAFKALKSLTNAELATLKGKDWIGRETTFRSLAKASPKSKVDKLHRFLYLSHFAYGKLRGKSFNPNADGVEATTIKRIERFRDRLRNVQVRHGHYAALVKEFDSKDTFFFLDPPYPGYDVDVGEAKFDETEFRKVLDGIKGRFLVTYGTRGKLDTQGFHVKKIRPPRSIRTMRGVAGPKTLTQLLIANYEITEKRLGETWDLEDVTGVVDLGDATSVQLERARALAGSLSLDDRGPVAALKTALDALESDATDRDAMLAYELSTLAEPLATAVAPVMPDLANTLRSAVPALSALGKSVCIAPRATQEPDPSPAARLSVPAVLAKTIPILKTGEERYVLGIVLEPETVDAQQDIYSAAEVREAAHRFMSDFQNVGLMHREVVTGRVKILESYVAPTDFPLDGTQVKKGTWLLAVRVIDDALWSQVKDGGLTGFSIGGSAVRAPTAAA